MSKRNLSPSVEGLASPEVAAEVSSSRPGVSSSNRQRQQKTVEQRSPTQPSAKIPSATAKETGKAPGGGSRKPPVASILPPEKVFPIQIGSDLFRLSGASISSDGSYHSQSHCLLRLRILEHPHTLPSFLKIKSDRMKKVAG